VPQWYSHLSQNAILEDDQIFLHKQERLIEIEQKIKVGRGTLRPRAAPAHTRHP